MTESARRGRLLLDLFCCAGGAAKGYADAGFDIIGVDIEPQPNYPYEFIQTDALALLTNLDCWDITPDAVHASPPCQTWSAMTTCRPGLAEKYPAFIEPVRERLIATGLPYVIENVPGAPLLNPTLLCGFMFGRMLYRHRLFESSVPLPPIEHPEHTIPASKAGHWKPGTVMSIAGHIAPIALARELMGIDWTTREELAEAIPPYYTEWVGRHLLAALEATEDRDAA